MVDQPDRSKTTAEQDFRALLCQAEAEDSVEIVVGRYFETDDGSLQLTKDEAVAVIRLVMEMRRG